MTPRPLTHREPTDEEMQCLPEGTLVLMNGVWKPTQLADAPIYKRHVYAVPITKQEDVQEPRRNLRDEFAMAALTGVILNCADIDFQDDTNGTTQAAAVISYKLADAMLAARNNQPEKDNGTKS